MKFRIQRAIERLPTPSQSSDRRIDVHVIQGVLRINYTKSKNHDLGFYARFFECNWWKTMRLLTAWRIKNNIEKSVRQSKVSIFKLVASYRFFSLNGRLNGSVAQDACWFLSLLCCGGLLVRLFDTYFYMLSNYFCFFLSDHNCLFECFDLFEHFAHK